MGVMQLFSASNFYYVLSLHIAGLSAAFLGSAVMVDKLLLWAVEVTDLLSVGKVASG